MGDAHATGLKRIPEDFEDLPDDEQQQIMLHLEEIVPGIDPSALREEIARLGQLIDAAHSLEAREVETKLTRLKQVITDQGIFQDPKMKLLIFTEHKDTLDYVIEKLEQWGLGLPFTHKLCCIRWNLARTPPVRHSAQGWRKGNVRRSTDLLKRHRLNP